MDIPNLAKDKQAVKPLIEPKVNLTKEKVTPLCLVMVAVSGIFISFWLSRFFPISTQKTTSSLSSQLQSADKISNTSDIEVGKVYGDANGTFSDTATGTIEKGSINGVGTHILNRQGGISQRASLTSSVVDLDMFIDKLVEIKGETNASDKTSWLLDVGQIKVLQ